MVFQTQKKRKSWTPGQVRVEKVLADAITIDGRKEWICRVLFQCLDAVAMQTMLLQVVRIVILEWCKRKEAPRPESGEGARSAR